MKNRKLTILLLAFCLCIISVTNVSAQSKNSSTGEIQMSQSKYNELIDVYGKSYVDNMDKETLDFILSHKLLSVEKATKYIVDTTIYDYNGNIINTISKEISKEEYDNFKKLQIASAPQTYDEVETNAKMVTLESYRYENTTQTMIVSRCVWKTIPKVKSFDVNAIRWDLPSGTSFNVVDYFAYQLAEGNEYHIQEYKSGTSNFKTASNGIGISMNIFDDTTISLESRLCVRGNIVGTIGIYSTYQHATSTTTLSQSQSYSFSSSGLGKVLYYSNSTIRNKYDNTPGLEIVTSGNYY